MECLKDCCRNLMKRRKEQELQGRPLSARRPPLRWLFSDGLRRLLPSDHAEGAPEPGGAVGAADRRRTARGCRRLPAVQTACGWQRGALHPAHLQGRLRPTQRGPLPQPPARTPEYVHKGTASRVSHINLISNSCRRPREPVFGVGVDLEAGLVNRSSIVTYFAHRSAGE